VQEGGLQRGTTAERVETTELFTRHANGIYHYCLRRLGSPEEAEDALQVTYLNAWRSLKGGCRPQARRAWLFQIAANVCASTLRSKLGGTRLELRDPGTLDELVAVEKPESEDLLGLREALRELPSRQRRALVLRDWQGLSYNEIATEMAVSDAAVETLLFRARSRVAAMLDSGEWRGKLATSARALVVWPFVALPTKSAATSASHLKAGLVLAGGTVAPLVAFGLIQGLVAPHEMTQPNRAAVVAQGAQPGAPLGWLQQGPLAHAVNARSGQQGRLVRTEEKPRKHAGSAHKSKSHSTAHPPAGPVPAPSAAAAPGAGQESKIVLCHGTPSDGQPGVTVSVSPNALAGLGEDPPGACG
jgi:RNA polymerase sigma-70 factor (ECF subfamily)